MKRTTHLLRALAGGACALSLLGAAAAPAFADDAVAPLASSRGSWQTDPATGEQLFYIDGAPANAVFVTDDQSGARYWFEGGRFVTEHAFFDPATSEWYWADADGTIARGMDVFIPSTSPTAPAAANGSASTTTTT